MFAGEPLPSAGKRALGGERLTQGLDVGYHAATRINVQAPGVPRDRWNRAEEVVAGVVKATRAFAWQPVLQDLYSALGRDGARRVRPESIGGWKLAAKRYKGDAARLSSGHINGLAVARGDLNAATLVRELPGHISACAKVAERAFECDQGESLEQHSTWALPQRDGRPLNAGRRRAGAERRAACDPRNRHGLSGERPFTRWLLGRSRGALVGCRGRVSRGSRSLGLKRRTSWVGGRVPPTSQAAASVSATSPNGRQRKRT